MLKQANESVDNANKVNTLLGTKEFPFKDEAELKAYLQSKDVAEAVKRHVDNWNAVIDPMYREAAGIDPNIELPSRGKYSGARLNLNPIIEGKYEPTGGKIVGPAKGIGGTLTGTMQRKSPFARKAYGTGQNYLLNYHESIANTFNRQLEIANKRVFDNSLIDSGNAIVTDTGKSNVTMEDGEDTQAFPFKRTGFENKSIYVRKSLAKEYAIASDTVLNPYKGSVGVGINKAMSQAALAGLTDAAVHVSNLNTVLFQVPGGSGTHPVIDSMLSAALRADIPATILRAGIKGAPEIGKTKLWQNFLSKYMPESIQDAVSKGLLKNMTQMATIAQINASRASHGAQVGGMKQLGQVVNVADRVTRMVLDDTYQNLVKAGLVENTETARREFINQAGNYNLRTQGPWMRLLRQTWTAPFITAGRNFAVLGGRAVTADPGVRAESLKTAALLRANMVSKWVGTLALVGTVNYLISGKMTGYPGTKALSVSYKDKDGKVQQFDVGSLTGQTRALRTIGARGAIEASSKGLTGSNIGEAAVRDVVNTGLSIVSGPGPRFAFEAATGYPTAINVGRSSRVVAPGESQHLENIREAVMQSNPILSSIEEYNKPGGDMQKAIARQIPRLTLTPGTPEETLSKYPEIVTKAQSRQFIDGMIHDAHKVPEGERAAWAMKELSRLPPEEQAHGLRELQASKIVPKSSGPSVLKGSSIEKLMNIGKPKKSKGI